ncbi:MAG: diguanylate cyclase [Nitrospirales bacterium]|nr:diguanylate cyclase [Nitrospirales bacterium]
MKVCFPVESNSGLESRVYNHFGSSPMFLIIDTDAMEVVSITNNDADHGPGACSPIRAMNGHSVDAAVVGGIGAGALNKLRLAGVDVFKAQGATVRENVAMLASGQLPEFQAQHVCAGHGHGGACHH